MSTLVYVLFPADNFRYENEFLRCVFSPLAFSLLTLSMNESPSELAHKWNEGLYSPYVAVVVEIRRYET